MRLLTSLLVMLILPLRVEAGEKNPICPTTGVGLLQNVTSNPRAATEITTEIRKGSLARGLISTPLREELRARSVQFGENGFAFANVITDNDFAALMPMLEALPQFDAEMLQEIKDIRVEAVAHSGQTYAINSSVFGHYDSPRQFLTGLAAYVAREENKPILDTFGFIKTRLNQNAANTFKYEGSLATYAMTPEEANALITKRKSASPSHPFPIYERATNIPVDYAPVLATNPVYVSEWKRLLEEGGPNAREASAALVHYVSSHPESAAKDANTLALFDLALARYPREPVMTRYVRGNSDFIDATEANAKLQAIGHGRVVKLVPPAEAGFEEAVVKPMQKALAPLGVEITATSDAFWREPEALVTQLEPIMKRLPEYKTEKLSLYLELSKMPGPIDAGELGKFNNAWDFAHALARQVLSPENQYHLSASIFSDAISTRNSILPVRNQVRASEVFAKEGNLSNLALNKESAHSALITAQEPVFYLTEARRSGKPIGSAFHPVLLTNTTYAKEAASIFESKNEADKEALAGNIVRFIDKNRELSLHNRATMDLFREVVRQYPHLRIPMTTNADGVINTLTPEALQHTLLNK